jgi:ParB/RepB/Spo0J family partition protein
MSTSKAALKAAIASRSVYQGVPGLDEFFDRSGNSGSLRIVRIAQIKPSPFQPRTEFDPDEAAELAANIRATNGVIQPVVVRMVEGEYELVVGERRLRGSEAAGFSEIPVVVRELTDDQAADMALFENVHRKNLNVLDEARGWAKAVERAGSLDAATEKYNKTRQFLSKRTRLAGAPDFVIAFMASQRSRDLEGLYDLTRLAEKNPDRARAIIAAYVDGEPLRDLVRPFIKQQKEGADESFAGLELVATPSEESEREPKKGRAAATPRFLSVDLVDFGQNAIKIRAPSGTYELRFTSKDALAALKKYAAKLKPWSDPAEKPAGSKGRK